MGSGGVRPAPGSQLEKEYNNSNAVSTGSKG